MYREQIEAYFDARRQELVDHTFRLVRIDSTKGEAQPGMPFGPGPVAALEEAMEMAREMGFAVTNYDNYVATVDLNDKPTQLDILAHLDVVPVSDDWTVTQPFEPVLKDGCLYGRGCADDKGPAVAALMAMKAVKDLGLPLEKNVRLILGTDEESGSADIAYYYAREQEAPMTFSPDAEYPLINIEKGMLHSSFSAAWPEENALPRVRGFWSGVRVNVIPDAARCELEGFDREQVEQLCAREQEKTGVMFRLEEQNGMLLVSAKGVGGHASRPEEGNSALTALLGLVCALPAAPSAGFAALQTLHSCFPHGDGHGVGAGVAMSDELSGVLTLCCNELSFELTGLKGTIDCRAPICATDETVRDVLAANLARGGVQLSEDKMIPPHHVPEDAPIVKALMKCYEEYTGRHERPLAIGGGTYVHELKMGVAFGCAMPGTDNRMHGADEFAVLDELVISAKMFTQAIVDICG